MHPFLFRNLHIVLIALGLAAYITGKETPTSISKAQLYTLSESGPSPVLAQAIFAGPAPGLAADVNLLGVFNAYDHIIKRSEENAPVWRYLKDYLRHASVLDPYFYDTYRLTSGLLAFQDKHTKEAVRILEYGSRYRPWDWETPLVAGFLAHSVLHDNKLAFDLMQTASRRPGAPPLLLSLATRFLADIEGSRAAIQFLRYMKSTMPKEYSKPIDDRIRKLEKEWKLRHEKP